ncbi:unnamed protein product [Ectocarpus fasciculatus]
MQVGRTDRGTSPPEAGGRVWLRTRSSFEDDPTVIRSCDDIPATAMLHAGGVLTLLGDVDCGKTPKTIEFTSGITELRSATSITTVGLDLVVHPGAHLTVQAPTVSIARTEASALQREEAMQDHPVLLVLGSVEFKVTTWLAQPLDGTAIDNHGTVWLGAQGSVRSDNEIMYTATSVMVSADKTIHCTDCPPPPYAPRASEQQPNVADSVASSEEPAFHTSDPETSSAAADSNDRDGDKNVAADDANPSASDREKADRKKTAAKIFITELMDRAGDSPSARDVMDRIRERHNGGKTEANNNDNNNNNNNSDNNSDNNTTTTIQQQQRQEERAFTAMVYATSIDGSVVHATATGTPPGNLEDRTIDSVPQTRRTLLEANAGRMAKVEGLRAEVMVERELADKAAVEGRGLKKSKMVNVLGFLPFGKHGFRRRRARAHAAAHIEEATLSVTNRGDLEVSVDGLIVLRKSGPSWFGFRKKDQSYEVRVTEDGVVVSRGGEYDWGIQARDLEQVVPATISFFDMYPDY